jgi:hypothetical protein
MNTNAFFDCLNNLEVRRITSLEAAIPVIQMINEEARGKAARWHG